VYFSQKKIDSGNRIISIATSLILVFLSLSYLTIFPSMIPGYNAIILMMLISIFLIRLDLIHVSHNLVFLLCIICVFYFIDYKSISIHTFIVFIIEIFVVALFFTIRSSYPIYIFIKIYLFICFLLSLGAIASFVIVNIMDTTLCQQVVMIEDLTNNRMGRGLELAQFYRIPCGLGLVEIHGSAYNLLGFNYYRASAWSHEPITAAFFLAPSIILLYLVQFYRTTIQWVVRVTILIAIFVAIQSLTVIIGMFSMLLFHYIVFFSKKAKIGISILLTLFIYFIAIYRVELLDFFYMDTRNIIFIKFYANIYYLEQIKYLAILIGAMFYFITSHGRKIITSDGNFKYALWMIVVLLSFYTFKIEWSFYNIFSSLFKNLSYILWWCLYISVYGNKHQIESRLDTLSTKLVVV
jgi:hypothetical protein